MSYAEANRMRRDMLELATAGFMRLVQGEVTDYGVTWSSAAKRLSQYQEFQTYIDIFGAESAQRLFRWAYSLLHSQQSYAIKNQLVASKAFGTQNTPIEGYFACSSLVLYGIRIAAMHGKVLL